MSIRNLDYLFHPRSVAVIGASINPHNVGGVVARHLSHGNFKGPVYFVNPKYDHILGRECLPSIAALPTAPDLAIIAIPAPSVPAAIEALGQKGCKAAVIISGGFDTSLRQDMLMAARPYVMRLLGPNGLGLILPHLGMNGSFAHLTPQPGKIAFLSQSGAILTAVIDWAYSRGIGFSSLLSLGDMADIDFGDLLDYLAGDSTTSAILIYMEAVSAARKFMSAARLAARSKPTIVIKSGRSDVAAKAVVSHTGALAGSDHVYDAALRRAGMLRVDDLSQLFAAAEILGRDLPLTDELTIVTNGGGMGILAADALAGLHGKLATLEPQTIQALDHVLPTAWSRANPVDIIGDATAKRYGDTMDILLGGRARRSLLVIACPTAINDCSDIAQAVLAAKDKADAENTEHSYLSACWMGDHSVRPARALLAKHGVANFDSPEEAVRAFSYCVKYRQNQILATQTPPLRPADALDRQKAETLIHQALAAGRTLLSGSEAFAVLASYGIETLPSIRLGSVADVVKAALPFPPPYALKILSEDIIHKSDAGGVHLDIPDRDTLAKAAAAMMEAIMRSHPDARLLGFTVEPMQRRSDALELILGIAHDDQFGPVLLFGAGGTAVEVINDKTMELPPLNMKLAHEMIRRTRIHDLLKAYRDRPAMPLDSIAETLIRLGNLAADRPEIIELDINPLLVRPTSIVAVDARIKLRVAPSGSGDRHLAIRPYPYQEEQWIADNDGTDYFIRPVMPEDEPDFIASFKQLSQQTIRMRFFAPLRNLSHAMAARLTQIDYDREMAWIIKQDERSKNILGVGRLAFDPDFTTAEYAILISDTVQGKGLGHRLMAIMITYARRHGVAVLFGDVLKENQPMLLLAKAYGFSIEPSPISGNVWRTRLDLTAE